MLTHRPASVYKAWREGADWGVAGGSPRNASANRFEMADTLVVLIVLCVVVGGIYAALSGFVRRHGPIPGHQLVDLFVGIARVYVDDDSLKNDFDVEFLREYPHKWEEWKDQVSELLGEAAAAKTKEQQIIAVRRATIGQLEGTLQSMAIVTPNVEWMTNWSEADGLVLAKHLAAEEDLKQVDDPRAVHLAIWVFAYMNLRALRAIAAQLDDAKKYDWMQVYQRGYTGYLDQLFPVMVAAHRGEEPDLAAGPMLKLQEAALNGLKERILEGAEFDEDLVRDLVEKSERDEDTVEP